MKWLQGKETYILQRRVQRRFKKNREVTLGTERSPLALLTIGTQISWICPNTLNKTMELHWSFLLSIYSPSVYGCALLRTRKIITCENMLGKADILPDFAPTKDRNFDLEPSMRF
jgi:hypothetical protein